MNTTILAYLVGTMMLAFPIDAKAECRYLEVRYAAPTQAGELHEYRASAVNGVGLKSEPAKAKARALDVLFPQRMAKTRADLTSAQVEIRRTAIRTLVHSDLSEPLREEIAAALKDPDADVRATAATAIGNLGAAAVLAVPTLIAQMQNDSSKDARETAARALGRIGKAAPKERQAVPPLRQAAAKDADPVTRVVALGALAMMEVEIPEQVTGLRKYLHNDNDLVRMKAAHALGMIGPAAKGAAAEIATVLERATDPHQRGTIARALGNTGDPASLPALYKALQKETDAGAVGEMRGAISRLGGKMPAKTIVATRPQHPEAATLRKIAQAAVDAKLDGGKPDAASQKQVRSLVAELTDAKVRADMASMLPLWEQSAARHARNRLLLAEIKRLGGKAISEVHAPAWLREIVGDDGLPAFHRIVEIDLNERTDGHKDPTPKKLAERVTDDWLTKIADQTELRRLELSGTAVTSAGLVHLKGLTNLEWLNVCLTAVDDRGFEHLAGLTKIRRMVVCSSKITGTGFQHLHGMKQIESINLHSSPASDAGLEAIGKLTSLRRLEIVHTNVTDAGLKHLAGLINLQQLHIHGPKTTEAALPFLGQLRELYQLDVYDRAASNQTLEHIGKLPKLRMLMLVNGNFDDDGVRHLAKLTALEELSLDSSKITEACIEHLAGLRNLRKLHLGRTKLTASGRDRLKSLLPTIEIVP